MEHQTKRTMTYDGRSVVPVSGLETADAWWEAKDGSPVGIFFREFRKECGPLPCGLVPVANPMTESGAADVSGISSWLILPDDAAPGMTPGEMLDAYLSWKRELEDYFRKLYEEHRKDAAGMFGVWRILCGQDTVILTDRPEAAEAAEAGELAPFEAEGLLYGYLVREPYALCDLITGRSYRAVIEYVRDDAGDGEAEAEFSLEDE